MRLKLVKKITSYEHFEAGKLKREKLKQRWYLSLCKIYLQKITLTRSKSYLVMKSDVPSGYMLVYGFKTPQEYSNNFIIFYIPNEPSWRESLTSGVICAVHRYECFIENKNKIRIFRGWKPSKIRTLSLIKILLVLVKKVYIIFS